MATSGVDFVSTTIDERYQSAIDFLFSRINYESTPDLAKTLADFPLARMQNLLDILGNPQDRLPCIHIAGSKGKGSTATMVARILEAAGLRVGLFTSPHAHQYEERLTVNQTLPTKVEIVEVVDRLRSVTEQMVREPTGSPTFFELTTAAGWLHFQNQRVDIAVVEVGLGGRLDSTNICNPLVTVISSISRDHTRLLGNTEDLIAREKAGIIKERIPVISGVTAIGPTKVIQEIAHRTNAPLLQLGKEILIESAQPPEVPLTPWSFDVVSADFSLTKIQLGMLGLHQTRNAALAVAAVHQLDHKKFPVNENHIRQGLSTANLPLRIQVLGKQPTVIVDAAHNPGSIAALCETVSDFGAADFGTVNRICLFSAFRDKEIAELLRILSDQFHYFILTTCQSSPRAVPVEELAAIADQTLNCAFETAVDPGYALQRSLEIANRNDLICATGSFFFAAELEEIWRIRNAT